MVLQYGVTVYRKTLLAHRFMSSPDIDEPTSTLVLILKMDSLHVIFEEVPNGTYHLVFTCAHMLLHLLPCHDQGHLHTAMLRQVIDANEPDSH